MTPHHLSYFILLSVCQQNDFTFGTFIQGSDRRLFVEQTDHLFDILSVVKICKHDNRHIITQMTAGKRLLNRPSLQSVIYINRSLTLRTAKAVGFLLR